MTMTALPSTAPVNDPPTSASTATEEVGDMPMMRLAFPLAALFGMDYLPAPPESSKASQSQRQRECQPPISDEKHVQQEPVPTPEADADDDADAHTNPNPNPKPVHNENASPDTSLIGGSSRDLVPPLGLHHDRLSFRHTHNHHNHTTTTTTRRLSAASSMYSFEESASASASTSNYSVSSTQTIGTKKKRRRLRIRKSAKKLGQRLGLVDNTCTHTGMSNSTIRCIPSALSCASSVVSARSQVDVLTERSERTRAEIAALETALSKAMQSLDQDMTHLATISQQSQPQSQSQPTLSFPTAIIDKDTPTVIVTEPNSSHDVEQEEEEDRLVPIDNNKDSDHDTEKVTIVVAPTEMGESPTSAASTGKPDTSTRASAFANRSRSSSFMRVHDLTVSTSFQDTGFGAGGKNPMTMTHDGVDSPTVSESIRTMTTLSTSPSSVSLSSWSQEQEGPAVPFSSQHHGGLIDIHHDLPAAIEALARFGYRIVTDEGPRWSPTRDTEKILSKQQRNQQPPSQQGKEILVWLSKVDHGGIGSELPMIKARGIVKTNAKNLVDLLLDSSRVKEYNKLSVGRTDELMMQSGFQTLATESPYGIKGEIKIIRSRSKPPILRKQIEMISVIHARELQTECEGMDGYLVVSRAVWEDIKTHDSSVVLSNTGTTGPKSIRTEMLLGVNLIRPLKGLQNQNNGCCEFTTVTHAYSPALPQGIAKRMAPSAASNFVRDIQNLYP